MVFLFSVRRQGDESVRREGDERGRKLMGGAGR